MFAIGGLKTTGNLKSSDIQNSGCGSLWEEIIHERFQLWACSDSVGEILVFFFGHPWKVVANDRTGTTWKFDSSTVYYICITDEVTYQIL